MRRQVRAARDALADGGSGGSDGTGPNGSGNGKPPRRPRLPSFPSFNREPRSRPRLKKLRLLLVLFGLILLAGVSFIFGIMMAVASDLPKLENKALYQASENSVITDFRNQPLTTLTGNEPRFFVESADISPTMKQAVVAIEDERFYEHRGIDILGIGRAVVKDVISRNAVQGASTITQQFVKNALAAQQSRTIFQKLRESALAYHLEREWSKDKILTQYLNSIYFGEGAYGIESAAKTYFGEEHDGCGGKEDRCAAQLLPHEAALLAGIISSPDAYSPRTHPEAAVERRNLVLQKMLEQGAITQDQYDDPITGVDAPLPDPKDIKPPHEKSEAPYFTSWLRQQVVDYYGAGAAFGGGLHIKSTLDLDLQHEVEEAVYNNIGGIAPTASVVVIDNETGGVRAMVGGSDYKNSPFNLATNGQRQPGSAMKPFTLVTALRQGISTSNVYSSNPKEFPFKVRLEKNGKETVLPDIFDVSNYGDGYYGSSTLYDATLHSDNSVYAELGLQVGLKNISDTAKAMGIQTDLSTENEYSIDGGPFEPYPPAMTLGGLEVGVTPLEMAYAYSTIANDGARVTGSLASYKGGPLGIISVKDGPGDVADFVDTEDGESGENEVIEQRAIDPAVASEVRSVLEANVDGGTGERAQYGGYAWGKTGTTENNGDAWFCGGGEDVTACVWVGHAEGNTPMETEFAGAPVDGGTYPALIWADVMSAYETLMDARKDAENDDDLDVETDGTVPVAPAPVAPAPTEPAPAPTPVPEAPVEEAPAPAEPAAPPAAPETAAGGGVEG